MLQLLLDWDIGTSLEGEHDIQCIEWHLYLSDSEKTSLVEGALVVEAADAAVVTIERWAPSQTTESPPVMNYCYLIVNMIPAFGRMTIRDCFQKPLEYETSFQT